LQRNNKSLLNPNKSCASEDGYGTSTSSPAVITGYRGPVAVTWNTQ
jgi:hypothetical protein